MKAIFNKVIVKEIKEKNLNALGVNMGKEFSQKFAKGKVISSGEKVENIKEDDIVWYDRHRASLIKINTEIFVVMENSNIFVVES